MTQATRLNPDFGGSAYTVVPNSCTNACMTRSSVSSLAMCCSASCNIPFAVAHSPEKAPPGCEQHAAVMLHEPQRHSSRKPILVEGSENCCTQRTTLT